MLPQLVSYVNKKMINTVILSNQHLLTMEESRCFRHKKFTGLPREIAKYPGYNLISQGLPH